MTEPEPVPLASIESIPITSNGNGHHAGDGYSNGSNGNGTINSPSHPTSSPPIPAQPIESQSTTKIITSPPTPTLDIPTPDSIPTKRSHPDPLSLSTDPASKKLKSDSLGTVFQIPRPRSPSPLPSPTKLANSTGGGSRNSSPAPSAAGTGEKLIELIKGSSIVDSVDGTKIELCKFVEDPKSYDEEGPLMRQIHWVFELRRSTTTNKENGKEETKVDVIIVRSKERTFQLKRAALEIVKSWGIDKSVKEPCTRNSATASTGTATPSPLPIAASLPTNAARSSPAPPSLPAIVPAPTPPAAPSISSMPREQLEALYASLLATHTSTLSLLTSYQSLCPTPSALTTLQKNLRSLQASRDSASSDFAYMSSQYQMASNAAVARAEECRIAEGEVERLKGLVETGLRQREKAFEGVVRGLRERAERAEGELRVVKEGTRRSEQRSVREKASRWDCWVREKEREEREEREGVKEEDEDTIEGEKIVACEWRLVGADGECGKSYADHQELRNHVMQDHLPPVVSKLA